MTWAFQPLPAAASPTVDSPGQGGDPGPLPSIGLLLGAGAAGAISGTADVVFAAGSSTLTGTGSLAGTAAEVFGAGSSTLVGSGALAGSSANVFGEGSSTLVGTGALAGSAAILFGGTNTLTGAGALAGSADIVFSGTNTLTGAGALAGSAAISFTESAVLTGSGALAGSAAITFTVDGTTSGGSALAGTAALTFGESAALTGVGALSGTAAAAFTVDGTVTNNVAQGGDPGPLPSIGLLLAPSAPGAMFGSAAMVFGGGSTALTGAGALAGTSAMVFTPTLMQSNLIGTVTLTTGGSATLTGAGALYSSFGEVTIQWTAASGATGYKVGYDTNSGDPYATVTDVGNVTSYTISGLAAGTWYINVRSYDGGGDSAWGNEITAVVNSPVSFTPTGTLTSGGALAGSAALVFAAGSSTLTGTGALAGTAAEVFGAGSSTLTGAGALAGSAALAFDGSGTLDVPSGSISGTVALAFDGSSTLVGTGALLGAADVAFSNSGTLTPPASTGGGGGVPVGGGRLRYKRGGNFVYGRVPQYIAKEHPKVARALAYAKRAAAKPELYDEYEEDFVAALRSLRGVLEEIQQQIDAAEQAENEKKQKQLEEHQAQLLAAKDAIEKALIKAHKQVQVLLAESAKLAEDVNSFLMSEAAIKKADRERQEAEDMLILQAAYAIFFDD